MDDFMIGIQNAGPTDPEFAVCISGSHEAFCQTIIKLIRHETRNKIRTQASSTQFFLVFRLMRPVQQFATAWADSGSDKNYDADVFAAADSRIQDIISRGWGPPSTWGQVLEQLLLYKQQQTQWLGTESEDRKTRQKSNGKHLFSAF